MSLPKEKMPMYDDRVNYIVRSLAAGITREELAEEFNHNDYRSLDMYMRRRNFRWDREEQNYKPVTTQISKSRLIDAEIHPGRVGQVIKSFEIEKDPKTAAEELGFKDHRELAKYMAEKGYAWNESEENYARQVGVENTGESNERHISDKKDKDKDRKRKRTLEKDEELHQIVNQLYKKLNLDENPIVDRVPRYLVKGISKNKTVPISHLLHQLIESFSVERDIPHREIVEVALVDFFRSYGYKHEVEYLFTNEQ